VASSAYLKAYYQRNREQIKARAARYRLENPEKAKAAVARCFERYDPLEVKAYMARYYRSNAEKIKARSRRWTESNAAYAKALSRARGKLWRQEFPHKNNAKGMRYWAAKRNRVPAWLSLGDFAAIEAFYLLARERTDATGRLHHVDHIIPLQGELVSGLHVPNNLQVLLAEENLRKLNRYG